MRDYRLILELGHVCIAEPPHIIHTDIKAGNWIDASAFARTAYPESDGWVVVDVVEIMEMSDGV